MTLFPSSIHVRNSELVYSKVKGVIETEVGFATIPNGKGFLGKERKSNIEVVKVIYSKTQISFDELINHFWDTHDVSDKRNQSSSYGEKSIIFGINDEQIQAAQEALELKRSNNGGKFFLTEVLTFDSYKKASDKDQKYYFKK